MNERRDTIYHIIKELLYIGILPLLFYMSAYYYLQSNFEKMPNIMIVVYICAILWIAFFCVLILKKTKERKMPHLRGVMVFIDKYYLKILLFCILIIFNMQSIFTMPRWDGVLYYSALIKQSTVFDFTLRGLVDGFRIVHPSHGYYCFLAIGAYLFKNQMVGILFMQMILYMLTVFCYFGLLRILFKSASEKLCFWGTLFFALSPLIYGIEPIISCDYGVLCYLIIFLYVSLKDYPLLELWVAVLLILSKQQGVLYYVAFYGIVFLVNSLRYYKANHELNIKEIFKVLRRMIPGFVGIGYYLLSSSSPLEWMEGMRESQNKLSNIGENSQTLLGIGFNGTYIIEKLRQIFILNFAWINWFIIFIGIGYLLYMRKKYGRKINVSAPIYGLIGIIVAFLAFNFFVVTHAFPRYLGVGVALASIGTFGMLNLCFKDIREKWMRMVLYSLTGISLISSFVSVDPVSFLVFNSFSVGKLAMYQPLYNNPNMYPSDLYADNTIYNRQFAFYTLLEEKMLKKIEYDGSIPLLEVDMGKEAGYGQGTYDYVNMMLEGMYGRATFYWNKENGKLTENADDIPMWVYYFWSEQIEANQVNWKGESLPETAYFILLPRQDNKILDTIKEKYTIERKYDISAYAMSLTVYKVQKR